MTDWVECVNGLIANKIYEYLFQKPHEIVTNKETGNGVCAVINVLPKR